MAGLSILANVVELNGKILAAVLLPGLFFCAGCSGVNHTQSVSPASFFLPGLLKNESQPDQPGPDSTVPATDKTETITDIKAQS
jgi:hypothetical protein